MSDRYAAISVGDELPEQVHRPSHVQLFRYSAATWNSHRIHYDTAYARVEGYPDVLVHSHLHGAFLTRLCTDWMGPTGRLVSLSLQVKRFATPEHTLTCRGRVVGKQIADGEGRITVDIEEVRDDGTVCAPGQAVIGFPLEATA
ncbi:MAG TPA: acyl dehydratase [Streptosporangiaceae bacterium]|jgi:hydroxyacyl-ACP dehydratase HTD2-like protein with hotdog domain